MRVFVNLFILIVLTFGCKPVSKQSNSDYSGNDNLKNKSAVLFSIFDKNGYKILYVYSDSGEINQTYYLVPKHLPIPSAIKNQSIIRTPCQRVVCLSTTHIAFIDALNETDHVMAVSGVGNVFAETLRSKAESGRLKDIGYESSLDFEMLLSLNPDLVTVYDINGTLSPINDKMKKLNIPVVQINEYLESTPLGQAEWIKFFAEFFDKRFQADSIFNAIFQNYNELKMMTESCIFKPSVLLNLPWKGIWYIPGGKSNVAQLIADAGGNYVWKDNTENNNIPLHIEDVFEKASNADFWLNPGDVVSIHDVSGVDTRLKIFKPVQNGSMFNRNKRLNRSGGNDYMESGTVRPDLILKDLIKILHPELLTEHEFYYYTKVK
jgi:iron complex transport system substrate-binding protein